MVKKLLPAIGIVMALSSCSSFRPLSFTSNKQVIAPIADPAAGTRFIENINVTPALNIGKADVKPEALVNISSTKGSDIAGIPVVTEAVNAKSQVLAARTAEVEMASATQLKYAILLNAEVESLPNKQLLEVVDEWYGVRYRSGGNTKSGVDCSGFTMAVYMAMYGMTIPRVSKEQYRTSRKISTTELQEGDLIFFNTTGRGVSHVGVYLGNNKFIHASVSKGVMVNDLFENYYLKRFVGAGRIDNKQPVAAAE